MNTAVHMAARVIHIVYTVSVYRAPVLTGRTGKNIARQRFCQRGS